MKREIKEVIDAIKKHKKFLITAHINLEGDSLCSQLAMLHLLQGMNKEARIIDADPVPPHLTFLPKAKFVTHEIDETYDYDAAIVLDCPNLRRVGRVQQLITPDKFIVNIDHHISNERFGTVNWVEPYASSVGEILHRLYVNIGAPVTEEAALYMYVALITDSGSFSYDNTTAETHRVAAALLEAGLKPGQVSEKVFESKTLSDMKLLGKIIETLRVNKTSEIAYLDITRKMLEETGADMSKTDTIVNYARSIHNVKVAILFREDPKNDNTIAISFRSKGDIDVNKIAKILGGGGHKKASGCMIKGSLDDVRRKVLITVEGALGGA